MRGHTFRIFVSSTFSDMKAERNALARDVFPRLRSLCESRGYKFQPVDLRWGVREEAGLDHETVRICLEEIARCQRLSPRPNFIVLMGDRYGWCPPPSTVPADEMDRLRPHLTLQAAEMVERWYRRDDNAVPAEFVLQPRRGKFEAYDEWQPIERSLRTAMTDAAERAEFRNEALRRYRASATEQEIVKGALETADAREHVFAFMRSIPNLEEASCALPNEAFRAWIDTLDDETWARDTWLEQRRLREAVATRLGTGNVWYYDAPLERGELQLAGIERDFCEAVWERLSRVIGAEMDALDHVNRDALEVEKRTHAERGAKRRRVFVGRAEPLARIAEYLKAGSPTPLVVHGPSGSGKAALLARAAEDARTSHPEAVVIERFVGASPAASEIRPLLESICREISRGFGVDPSPLDDYQELLEELPKRLALATPERPIFVFLAALDRIGKTDDGPRLAWLTSELPPNARLVVSTANGEPLRAAARQHDANFLFLERLPKADGRELLDRLFRESKVSRRLTDGQRDALLTKFEREGLPLFLVLAFERALHWHSYDGVSPATELPDDFAGVIRAFLARLSEPSRHGEVVVARALSFLAAARYGVADEEMLDLLWRHSDVRGELRRHTEIHQAPPVDALPAVIWSRLSFDLEPYLAEREVFGVRLRSFDHPQFLDVVEKAHLSEERSIECRRTIAAMLRDQANYFGGGTGAPNLRKLYELPWQLDLAEAWTDLAEVFEERSFADAWVRERLWTEQFPTLLRALSRSRLQGDYGAANRLSNLMLSVSQLRGLAGSDRPTKEQLEALFDAVDASEASADATWHKYDPEAHALANMAAELHNAGRREVAHALLQKALSIDPDLEPAHFNLGLVSLDRGDRVTAEKHLREVTRINPEHRRARELLRTIETLRTPEEYLKEALLLVNFRQDMDAGRALLAEGRERYPESEKLLRAAESLDRFAGRSARHSRPSFRVELREGEVDRQDGDGKTALHFAIIEKQAEAVELLLSTGANPNVADRLGWRPLHLAAKLGQTQIARKLLDRGATVDERNQEGASALHLAAAEGNTELVLLLLTRAADRELRDGNGATPIHDAVNSRNPSTVEALMEAGADVNSANDVGWTPLHIAAKRGLERVVDSLVSRGADTRAATRKGSTPIELAMRAGHTSLAARLTTAPASGRDHTASQPTDSPGRERKVDSPLTDGRRAAEADRAAELNIAYQRELAAWNKLSWLKRLTTKKPVPPSGI